MGDRNPAGQIDNEAWRTLGWDIDGKSFGPDSTGGTHCQPVNGTADVVHDGQDGIDNSFAHAIVIPLVDYLSDTSVSAAESGEGSATLTIFGVPMGSTDAAPVMGQIGAVVGVKNPASGFWIPPTEAQWSDGTYPWVPLSVLKAETTTSTTTLDGTSVLDLGFFTGDTWVGSSNAPFTVPVRLTAIGWLPLVVRHGWVVAHLSADRRSVTDGLVGGVVSARELTEFPYVGGFSPDSHAPDVCPHSAVLAEIVATILGAADMMVDGSQDPTRTCDGISFAIGFTAQETDVPDQQPIESKVNTGCPGPPGP